MWGVDGPPQCVGSSRDVRAHRTNCLFSDNLRSWHNYWRGYEIRDQKLTTTFHQMPDSSISLHNLPRQY